MHNTKSWPIDNVQFTFLSVYDLHVRQHIVYFIYSKPMNGKLEYTLVIKKDFFQLLEGWG